MKWIYWSRDTTPLGVVIGCVAFLWLLAVTAIVYLRTYPDTFHPADPQAAAGTWTIEIQTPPCDLQRGQILVTPPKESGAPMSVTCTQFSVQER